MGKKDAEISIGADASAIERVAGAAKAAWRDAGASITSSFGYASRSAISSLSDIALAQGKVNLSSQHAQVREFEASTARMAVSTGRSLEGVRSSFEATGVAIGKRPQEVANWTQEVGRLTYSYDGAADAIKGMSGLAAETGRSVEDYRGLAVVLGTVGKVSGDTSHAIGMIHAQADKMKTVGGPAALADQIEGLGDIISHFAVKSEADFTKITGLAATLGKGLSPQASQRVQQGALGSLTSDQVGWSRFLGRDISDDSGQVKDPTQVLSDIVAKVKKQYGKSARRVLQQNFGSETGAALFKTDFREAESAAGVAPSGAPKGALNQLLGTDAGKRQVAEATLSQSSRELLGSSTALGRAADSLQQYAAHNPITSTLVATALGTGASSFMRSLGTTISSMTGGKGAAGGAGGVFGGAKALPVIGAAIAGLGAGAELGQYLGDNYGDQIDAALGDPFGNNAGKRKLVEMDAETRRLKVIRDKKRARVGFPFLSSAGASTVNADGVPSALALDGGGAPPSQASDDSADRMAKAVAAVLKDGLKVTVVNATGGPVEAVEQGRQSAAAGSQG